MPPPASDRRFLTGVGYLGFVLIGWNSVVVPSLIRSIEHDFHQSDASFSLLYLLQSLVYSVAAVGGGMLTERLGRKIVLPAAAVLPAAGWVLASTLHQWALFVLVALPVSCGAGIIDSGVNALFLDAHREARGGALNLLHAFFSVGALLAPTVVGLLVSSGLPWRGVLLITAGGFLLLVPLAIAAPMPSGRHAHAQRRAQSDAAMASERSLVPFVGLALAIGLYVAAEIGVSSWVVRYLAGAPLAAATGVLSLFWAGLTAGRVGSHWVAERVEYFKFTWGCFLLGAVCLGCAVFVPWLALKALFFALTGLFFGPPFPMIMALGGNIYPHRLSALSGALTGSAVAGSIFYAPLMGVLASRVGLGTGMLGAALLGLPAAGGILLAQRTSAPSAQAHDSARAGS